MAKIQTAPELNISPKLEAADLLSLTLQSLQLASPWRAPPAPPAPPAQAERPECRTISLGEVANHDSARDCWVIIYDRVYDITTFMDEHPGGADIMLEYAGRDASTAFRGSGHSRNAKKALERFLVGELPLRERIYRKPGGIKLSDMPE